MVALIPQSMHPAVQYVRPQHGMDASEQRASGGSINFFLPRPYAEVSAMSRVSRLASIYGLTPGEKDRLYAVVDNFPVDELIVELRYELDSLLADRILRTLPPLTADDMVRVMAAIESGKVDFALQDVN